MKQQKKQTILNCINIIYEDAHRCNLQPDFLKSNEAELETIARFLGVNTIEAYFTSVIFGLSCHHRTVDISDMFRYMDCNAIRLLEYNRVFVSLCEKGIIKMHGHVHRRELTGINHHYVINKIVIDAILDNRPLEPLKKTRFDDIIELMDHIWSLGEQLSTDEITSRELFFELKLLLDTNKSLPLVKHIMTYNLGDVDTFIYLMLIWDSLQGKMGLSLERVLNDTIHGSGERVRHMQSFMNGRNDLIRNQLCELDEGGFLNDSEVSLTEQSRDMLRELGLSVASGYTNNDDIIKPDQVKPRELIFDREEMKQLELLSKTITEPHFSSVRERLASRNMPMGITAVLHGPPGTGKTEAVKQLARTTGREIMEVDISETKSMWFGKSEKLIKGMFRLYRDRVKSSKLVPILLFNEADGVLSTRRQIGNSNVGQTENAIQNILLDELEKFEGILIATTNLVTNLDKAFERRFLFKIKFSKPGIKQRARIWKLKIPVLSDDECNMLAGRYHLSGGQIDNIARKSEIQDIVYGEKSSFNNIISFCDEEVMGKAQPRIGYQNKK